MGDKISTYTYRVDNMPIDYSYIALKAMWFIGYALLLALIVLSIIVLIKTLKLLPDIKTALKIYIRKNSDKDNQI